MKIAIFKRLDFEDTEARFKEEAKKLGIDLVWIKYRDLRMEDDSIYFRRTELKNYNGWYFRAVGSELEWSKLLQLYGKKHRVKAVDQYLMKEGALRRFKSVMSWQLINAGVNYPRFSYVDSLNDLKAEIETWEFPLIIKLSQGGRHGMGTFFLKQKTDFAALVSRLERRQARALEEGKRPIHYHGFLIQEYIENDGDYRVMTVGYKCIGGFKRQPKTEKLVLNKSTGRSVGLEKVPRDVAEVAEKAARVLGVEVAGTDLVRSKSDGKVYVIEVNEAPQFKVFEKRTGVNVARKILEYCVSKFK